MKKYEAPVVEVEIFTVADVMTSYNDNSGMNCSNQTEIF